MRPSPLPVLLMLLNLQVRLKRPQRPGVFKAIVDALLCALCCLPVAAFCRRPSMPFSPGLKGVPPLPTSPLHSSDPWVGGTQDEGAVLRDSSCSSISIRRRLAAGSLALPACRPEKPCPYLAGRPFTRSALGAVCQLSATATIGEGGETRMSWGFSAREVGWVGAALTLATLGSMDPGEVLVTRAGWGASSQES